MASLNPDTPIERQLLVDFVQSETDQPLGDDLSSKKIRLSPASGSVLLSVPVSHVMLITTAQAQRRPNMKGRKKGQVPRMTTRSSSKKKYEVPKSRRVHFYLSAPHLPVQHAARSKSGFKWSGIRIKNQSLVSILKPISRVPVKQDPVVTEVLTRGYSRSFTPSISGEVVAVSKLQRVAWDRAPSLLTRQIEAQAKVAQNNGFKRGLDLFKERRAITIALHRLKCKYGSMSQRVKSFRKLDSTTKSYRRASHIGKKEYPMEEGDWWPSPSTPN